MELMSSGFYPLEISAPCACEWLSPKHNRCDCFLINQSDTSENLTGPYLNISFYFYAVFSFVHVLVFKVFKLNSE